jgi:peptide/nickel transport system permease protein
MLATAISLTAGLTLGALAGYYGGWIDELLMRVAELFLALPWLYLLLAVRAFLPLSLSPGDTFLLISAVIGLVGWARPARLVRGIVLSASRQEYVAAVRAFGASDLYLLRRHILPQTWSLLLTQAALLIPQYILAEVALSFLGLGVGQPDPSWGNMLASLRQAYILSSCWWMAAPGLVLSATTLCYYSLTSHLETSLLSVAKSNNQDAHTQPTGNDPESALGRSLPWRRIRGAVSVRSRSRPLR